MKEELDIKHVPPSFSARLMDNWHQHTQGHKSAKEYVEKFDEFLIRCNTFHKEGEALLSRFRAGLRDDLWTELLARGVTELEAAHALVQDLDSARTNHPSKSGDYKASVSRPSPSSQSRRSSTQTLSDRDDIKGKSLERDNINKGPDSFRVSSTIKCYKCHGYGYLAASCPSFISTTIIDGIPTEATDSDSDVYIFRG